MTNNMHEKMACLTLDAGKKKSELCEVVKKKDEPHACPSLLPWAFAGHTVEKGNSIGVPGTLRVGDQKFRDTEVRALKKRKLHR